MILAIDPGLTGAAALYDPDTDFLSLYAMPVQWRMVNKKKKHEVDVSALRDWIAHRQYAIAEAIVEQPAAMPGVGAVSQFTFGKTCGQCEALIVGMGIPLTTVHPVKWKSALDVPSDKRRSRGRAAVLFPAHAAKFERADSEGQAEAAMLALYRDLVNRKLVMPTPTKITPGEAPRTLFSKAVSNAETRPGKLQRGRSKKTT
jgi:hypothetical protein